MMDHSLGWIFSIWSIQQYRLTTGFSCSSQPGAMSTIGFSTNGVGTCYLITDDPMDLEQAWTFCETSVGGHLAFFEDQSDQTRLESSPGISFIICRKLWIGINKVGTKWFWRYWMNNTGVEAHYTAWRVPGATNVVGVLDLDATTWIEANPSDSFHGLCEIEENAKSHLIPLPNTAVTNIATSTVTSALYPTTPDRYTSLYPVSSTSLAWDDPCVARSRLPSFGIRQMAFTKDVSGEVHYAWLAIRQSLLSCAQHCVQQNGCCSVGYSKADNYCYGIPLPTNSDAPTIDCALMDCYTMR